MVGSWLLPWLQVGRGFMAFSCRWVVGHGHCQGCMWVLGSWVLPRLQVGGGSWPLSRLQVDGGVVAVVKAVGGCWGHGCCQGCMWVAGLWPLRRLQVGGGRVMAVAKAKRP